ncbi:hypothetical protein [Dongia sp.]|uniref:hypothetical protein n=1 Tax=Dongia sp. TaxID=1977262 RepID=UPI003750C5C5
MRSKIQPSEAPYQNREIREMVDDVRNSLTRIELQTTRTNGRVTKLERTMLIIVTGTAVYAVPHLPGFIAAILAVL